MKQARCPNHKSATSAELKCRVETELLRQINQGHYVVASAPPAIISPLAAIPKEGSDDVRLIHDGSRPCGSAMNDYVEHHSVRYQTIDDACKIAKPGYFCAKVDLQAAYRSVPIHPDCYKAAGLAWTFEGNDTETILFDTRLPFGSKCGPSHFSRISQAITRMMKRKGYEGILCYIDDFFLAFESYDACNEALLCLIHLIRSLGLNVSWKKVIGPTQHVTFLGVDIDTVDCTLSLNKEKLDKLHNKLQQFQKRKRASLKQLQSLAGSLNWAAQVIRGGRFFLRRILDTMNRLNQAKHKAILGVEFRRDLKWWLSYMYMFNGRIFYRDSSDVHVHVDACRTAAGSFCEGDWRYSIFSIDWPAVADMHINYKEVCAIVDAVQTWAPMWANRKVVMHTDSSVAKAIINRGRSKNAYINQLLRAVCWQSVRYNFELRAIHIPGLLNSLPDTISRLHEPGKVATLDLLLSRWHHGRTYCMARMGDHMSTKTSLMLQARLN